MPIVSKEVHDTLFVTHPRRHAPRTLNSEL
jgi:hypothetical protein